MLEQMAKFKEEQDSVIKRRSETKIEPILKADLVEMVATVDPDGVHVTLTSSEGKTQRVKLSSSQAAAAAVDNSFSESSSDAEDQANNFAVIELRR